MKGITVYLKENERRLLCQAIMCYIDTMETGDDTGDIVREELKNGLASGLAKLTRKVG